MKSKVSLKDWINREGASAIAKKLGLNVSTVRHWRRGHCLPSSEQMLAIKKLSKGAITCDDMIEQYHGAAR